MKISKHWLKEWLPSGIPLSQLTEQLTLGGFPVDATLPVAVSFSKVIVGEIEEVTPHPESARLKCCRVFTGKKTLNIICGASNVTSGIKVAVVLVGGELAGVQLGARRLSGVLSEGMICSAKELGLAEEDNGQILILPTNAPLGANLREYLDLEDEIIDIDVTPNRGDCLSIVGLAREVAAFNQCQLTPYLPSQNSITSKDKLDLEVTETVCPLYTGRIIRHLNPMVKTPIMMQERLRRGGLRSVSFVVDVLNYVMLELGQPLHAFDLKKWGGQRVEVRHAKEGEKIIFLGGQEVQLSAHDVVVADSMGPQALAGVLGGASTAIASTTRDIFLESAIFDAGCVAQSVRKLNLKTEASFRFERGIDPALPAKALERATELLLTYGGGAEPPKVGPISESSSLSTGSKKPPIFLSHQAVEATLGLQITQMSIEGCLTLLGMRLQSCEGEWIVTIPGWRHDLQEPIDLIEEVARLYGYDRIDPVPCIGALNLPDLSKGDGLFWALRRLLVARGYHEAITYSFVEERFQKQVMGEAPCVSLSNPIADTLAVMRLTLWPGLLEGLRRNQNRQIHRVLLFEIGKCFKVIGPAGAWEEETRLAGIRTGPAHDMQWGEKERPVDFYDIAADTKAALGVLFPHEVCVFQPKPHPALHPGQAAVIYKGNKPIGYLGQLHPDLVYREGFQGPVYLFEMTVQSIAPSPPCYQPLPKFPSVRRDLAVVVPQEVLASQLESEVRKACGGLLNNMQIFDIYAGKGIEYGKKSVAVSLTFQHSSRTLIDEEVNQVMGQVIKHLEHVFKATLRA